VNGVLLALALAANGEVTARVASAQEMRTEVFEPAWRLPDALWMPSKDADRLALAVSVPALLAERFEGSEPWMRSVGDIIAEHRSRGGDHPALERVLRELAQGAPAAHARVGKLLSEVLDARELANPAWNPDIDQHDDGMYFGALLARNKSSDEPWRSQSGARTFHQAVTFVRADLDAILGAIHDYASSIRDPKTSYERLEPLADSLLVGTSDALGDFAALRVRVRSDLPFPFTHYDCDLRVLHTLESGTLVTDIYSPSRDFYWFAGKDWYLPVRASDGTWLGTMIVRLSGFDLSGVPDGDDDRKSGTRTALGSVRRRAEASFAAAGGVPRTIEGAIPKFVATVPAKSR
jgi:hypothetical protein